jgi:putative transposase
MDASLQSRAEQLAAEFAGQARTVDDLNGFLRLMMKSGLERMLNTELDVHLGRRLRPNGTGALPAIAEAEADEPTMPTEAESPPPPATKRPPNRRNGHSQKTVQGDMGELTLSTPRDRDGTFEPQLIAKHQRRVPGFDEKILALYARG